METNLPTDDDLNNIEGNTGSDPEAEELTNDNSETNFSEGLNAEELESDDISVDLETGGIVAGQSSDFKEGIVAESENEDLDQELIKSKFKDFLVVPKISRNEPGKSKSSRIPVKDIQDSGEKITISDEISQWKSGKKHSTVLVNRTKDGEVHSIEVLCSCGETSVIKFDYKDSE